MKSWEGEKVNNKIDNRIMDSDKWPNLQLSENLELLNELADESFSTQTVSGMLASTLMYHQIIEAMCLHLLDNCHFQIQLAVYPAMIDFSIKENKMLGSYIQELKNSISFHKKDEFINKVTEFNGIRNDLILVYNNLSEVAKMLKRSKAKIKWDSLIKELQNESEVNENVK